MRWRGDTARTRRARRSPRRARRASTTSASISSTASRGSRRGTGRRAWRPRSASGRITSAATPCSWRLPRTSGPRHRGLARCAGGSGWWRARTTASPPSNTGSRRRCSRRPDIGTTSSAPGRCPGTSPGTTRRTGRDARTPASAPGRTPSTASTSGRGTRATSTSTSPTWRRAEGRWRVSIGSTRRRAPSRRWPSACGGSTESSAGRSPPSSEPIRWIALPAAWPTAVRAN